MILSAVFFRACRAYKASSAFGLAALLMLPCAVFAQTAAPTTSPLPAASVAPSATLAAGSVKPAVEPGRAAASQAKAAAAPVGPAWSELTPMQQQSLKPLAAGWNTINESQKRKWLEISKNYATLSPDDQGKLHSRMNEWVALSSQQRAQARLNFAKTKELSKQLTPDEKKAKWQTYQALSAEEKAKLAQKAPPQPTGAATAIKPVAPQKLTAVQPHSAASAPDAKKAATAAPKMVVSPAAITVAPAAPPQPALPPAQTAP